MAQTVNNAGNNTVGASNTGQTNTFTVTNPSNTSSSAALINVTVGGTSSDDAFTTYTVAGTTNWSQGVDNSDSDAYVLAASTALGTTNVIRASTAGEINYPLQPAFFAYLPTSDNNATGDATTYTLGAVTALTEVFDQNSDFNTNGTFTAPVTGRYFFQTQISLTGATALTSVFCTLVASNRTPRYDLPFTGPAAIACRGDWSIFFDMDAADTITSTINASDTGGKVDDIVGNADPRSWFCGYLVC